MVNIPKIVIHQENSLQFDMTFIGFILKFAFSYSMNAFTGLNPCVYGPNFTHTHHDLQGYS